MKFKTKEEIIKQYNNLLGQNIAYENGVNDSFKSFVERLDSFKKYYCQYERFKKDNPDIRVQLSVDDDTTNFEFNIMFNDWLFDYCFREVKNE